MSPRFAPRDVEWLVRMALIGGMIIGSLLENTIVPFFNRAKR